MRTLLSLLKACLVASAVFAIAWIRAPNFVFSLKIAFSAFVIFGSLITIISMFIGLPIVLIMTRLRIWKWWAYTMVAATTGAVIGGLFTYRSDPKDGEIANPFTFTFSPWTRNRPWFAEDPPYSILDFIGSAIFGAIVGASLGLAFWYFYTRGRNSTPSATDVN